MQAASLAAVQAAAPLASGLSGFARAPYLQNLCDKEVTLRWLLAEPEEWAVRLEMPTGPDRVVPGKLLRQFDSAGQKRFLYHARLGELLPGTSYQYRMESQSAVVSALAAPKVRRFQTAGQSNITFLVIGDTGTGSPQQFELAQTMATEPADLLLHTGDVAYPVGNVENYSRYYLDFYAGVMDRVPFFPCPGNHDCWEDEAAAYRALHELPTAGVAEADHGRYYNFSWGGADFFSLDTNLLTGEGTGPAETRMKSWFRRQLGISRAYWRIVSFHHTANPTGHHLNDGICRAARNELAPLLEAAGVPVVFSGHEHNYQRTFPMRGGQVEAGGTTYFVAGGGGAGLHPAGPHPTLAAFSATHHFLRTQVQGRAMTVSMVNAEGRVLDQHTLRPAPFLRAQGGVVNAAGFGPGVGRNSLVTLFGAHLGLAPREADGLRVHCGGRELELLFVSPTQVNAVLPAEATGRQTLVVESPAGRTEREIEISSFAPGLFPPAGMFRASQGQSVRLLATGLFQYAANVELLWNGVPMPAQLEEANGPIQAIRFQVPPVAYGELQATLAIRAAGQTSNLLTLELI